jgi:hypothetical protein
MGLLSQTTQARGLASCDTMGARGATPLTDRSASGAMGQGDLLGYYGIHTGALCGSQGGLRVPPNRRISTMREFTELDLHNPDSQFPTIYAVRADLIDAPLSWQRAGLQQTASGYGKQLTMQEKIHYMGRKYRLYCTCFSNAGSVWFTVRGRKIYVN